MEQVCNDNKCKYSRFADDQIILFDTEEQINNIMLVCNEELRKIGLNLNAGKVKKFSHAELIDFYLFNILEKIDLKKYDEAASDFFELYDAHKEIRSDTFFRRCLTVELKRFSISNRNRIVSIITNEEFIIKCGIQHLSGIYKNLYIEEKQKFLDTLFIIFKKIKFNGFKYTVITFAKKNKLNDFMNKCVEELE